MAEGATFCEMHDHARVSWKLHKFFELPERIDHKLQSPRFSVSETTWFIQIHPNGQSLLDTAGWVGLYLHKEESTVEHRVLYSIRIKNADGSDLKCVEFKHIFKRNGYGMGCPKFFKRSTLLSSKDTVTLNGTLTVLCNVKILNNMEVASTTLSDGLVALSNSFKDLYQTGSHSDVTLKVQNKEFRAHKLVLGARSTVFSSMFQHDMLEKSSGRVDISDCDSDTFEKFLLFLYTGELNSVTSNEAINLYKTSEKYDLKELKEECMYRMRRELSADSFCDVIHLANLYNESGLLKFTTEYFTKNAKFIIKTTKWEKFLAENSCLGNELFSELLNAVNSDNN